MICGDGVVLAELMQVSFERGQSSGWNKDTDGAGCPRSSLEVPPSLKRKHHLVNRWRRDLEVPLDVRLSGWAPIDLVVVVDKRQVLALAGGKRGGHVVFFGLKFEMRGVAPWGSAVAGRLAFLAFIGFDVQVSRRRFLAPLDALISFTVGLSLADRLCVFPEYVCRARNWSSAVVFACEAGLADLALIGEFVLSIDHGHRKATSIV